MRRKRTFMRLLRVMWLILVRADKYVDGEWSDKEIENGFTNWICAYYNPYECDGFMNTATEQVYETAKIADLSNLDKVIYVFAPLTSNECMV